MYTRKLSHFFGKAKKCSCTSNYYRVLTSAALGYLKGGKVCTLKYRKQLTFMKPIQSSGFWGGVKCILGSYHISLRKQRNIVALVIR